MASTQKTKSPDQRSGRTFLHQNAYQTNNPPVKPKIEVGDSGSSFIYARESNEVEFNKIAYNVGLKIKRGLRGLEVSTRIRDKYGLIVAEINNNHWTVKQTAIWDKNYTNNALEVLDARDQVVFQIRFLFDRVQIQSEWRDEFGHGLRWSKCAAPDGSTHGCITPWGNTRTEQQNAQVIEPIFQYQVKSMGGIRKKIAVGKPGKTRDRNV